MLKLREQSRISQAVTRASGYWVDTDRATTIEGLFAGGDVAGGCPQKYVTGALAEGEIAGLSAVKYIDSKESFEKISDEDTNYHLIETEKYLTDRHSLYTTEQLEEAMQKVMDQYAGGIATDYQYNEERLVIGKKRIGELLGMIDELKAKDMFELKDIYEVRERLIVCQTLIEHLRARKETRWHSFAENLDHPQKSDDWKKYVNTKKVDGKIKVILRELVKEDEYYEHQN